MATKPEDLLSSEKNKTTACHVCRVIRVISEYSGERLFLSWPFSTICSKLGSCLPLERSNFTYRYYCSSVCCSSLSLKWNVFVTSVLCKTLNSCYICLYKVKILYFQCEIFLGAIEFDLRHFPT